MAKDKFELDNLKLVFVGTGANKNVFKLEDFNTIKTYYDDFVVKLKRLDEDYRSLYNYIYTYKDAIKIDEEVSENIDSIIKTMDSINDEFISRSNSVLNDINTRLVNMNENAVAAGEQLALYENGIKGGAV